MFVADLFEAKAQKTVVIISGGFHPFHPGHLSLYTGALKAFPGADVYVAASNDTKTRPFPFKVKRQLAAIAGVPPEAFVFVKRPFVPNEITSRYDPNNTVLIFVRSDKDIEEQPLSGDGSEYRQPLTKNPEPLSQHGYMVYLPAIEFKAGPSNLSSATEIRDAWPKANPQTKQAIVSDLYPRIAGNAKLIQQVVSIFDRFISNSINESVNRTDSKTHLLVQKARTQYPLAKSDEEALALYISDREQQDYDRLDRENDQEDDMIGQLQADDMAMRKRILELENQIAELTQAIQKKVMEQASGVIATPAQAKDPRYSMSLTKDVRPGQVEKNLRAFGLIGGKKK